MQGNRIAAWLAGAVVLAGVSMFAAAARSDANALWNIVHGACVPDQQRHGDPAPCAEVDLNDGVEAGYAVLKDRYGATQYLLIPTARVVGIESPSLLAASAVNYFAAAWTARRFVEQALGHAMPIDTLSLAVNSQWARSQNQLHIHIDCIRADVRQTLENERAAIGERWSALAAPLAGQRYLAMRVMGQTLKQHNPFKLLAEGVPGASADMGERTLAVAGMLFDGAPGFVVVADRADLLHGDFAGGSLLQDHSCALAH